MACQVIPKNRRFISLLIRLKFFANGEVSACLQGKNGSTMALQKCAMIIGDCKVSMAIYDGILSTEEIIASLYSIKSR